MTAPRSSPPVSAAKQGTDLLLRFLEVDTVSPYMASICGAAWVLVLFPRGRGAHRSMDSRRGSYNPSLSPKHPNIEGNQDPETARGFSRAPADTCGSARLVILPGCHLPITSLD